MLRPTIQLKCMKSLLLNVQSGIKYTHNNHYFIKISLILHSLQKNWQLEILIFI